MITQGTRPLGNRQTAFDAEAAAIEELLRWYETSHYHSLRLHERDRLCRPIRAGPGQECVRKMQQTVAHLLHQNQTAEIACVKGHAGTPGNERTDVLARKAAEKTAWSPITSLAHLKLRISEKFQKTK
jgi:ribonuclease HI